jgi:acyl transferase domain-containing protein/acyl carrier protein
MSASIKNRTKLGNSKDCAQRRAPIAIVGMACRYPGDADNPTAFWQLLCEGRDCIREITPDRWSLRAIHDPEPGKSGKTYTRHAGLINRMDQFDPHFFGISPREAQAMDPQQRLLLETAWEALEDAGQVPEQLAGSRTGVFIGISTHDYGDLMSAVTERKVGLDQYLPLGSALCIAANRISYCFDLRGPSFAVDTACSSSLVALHLACESIWNGESSTALVGGSNAILKPEMTLGFSSASMLSPDGRCKSFDARANGYVRAEGAGMLLLKPLAAARRDGDRVYSVVLATAINQDGHTPGISVPNGESQAVLVREACAKAGIRPRDVQFIEAHGTGTPVGDPIEATALGDVVSEGRPANAPCILGSVKSNIGHLEAGAGVAGVMKVALSLFHGAIPPNLHFQSPNPQIDMDRLCLRVPTQLEPWPEANGATRLAGVNSFGFGGTNAHALLGEPPRDRSSVRNGNVPASGKAWLLPLSARSKEALEAMALSYRDFLTRGAGADAALVDLVYSAGVRRTHHAHRLALVADSRAALTEQLNALLAGDKVAGLSVGKTLPGSRPTLVFVFTGMGPQWWAMGQQLLHDEPVFRKAVERCNRLFRGHMRDSILEEMSAPEDRSRMDDDRFAQMGNFTLQVGLAALWEAWGIKPDMIVGHSVGEVAAAYVSGALSLDDAVQVSYHRSRLQHRTRGEGKMLAVGLSLQEARRLLLPHAGQVSIAAINGPQAVTLSGDADALAGIHEELSVEGTFSRILQVDIPYHSPKMDPLREELFDVLSALSPHRPEIPLYSTVTGALLDENGMNAEYWWSNVREPVQFARVVEKLLETGHGLFLEVGPHPVLSASIQECALATNTPVQVLTTLRHKEPERATMLAALGRLYTTGLEIDWQRFHPHAGRLMSLPTYPWQRERYWRESDVSRDLRTGDAGWSALGHFGPIVHPLLGHALVTAHAEAAWDTELEVQRDHGWLADHKVQGAIVFPAAGHVEMALAAATQLFGADHAALAALELDRPLFLSSTTPQPVQLLIDRLQKTFTFHGKPFQGKQSDGPWVRYSSGKLDKLAAERTPPRVDVQQVVARCPHINAKPACYEMFKSIGLEYGPVFAGIEQLWTGDREALARITVAEAMSEQVGDFVVFPGVLDAAFQSLLGTMASARPRLYLPARIGAIRVHRRLDQAEGSTRSFWSHARLVHQDDARLEGDITILDDQGNVLVEVQALLCRALAERGDNGLQLEDCLHHERWLLQTLPGQGHPDTAAWALPHPGDVAHSVRLSTATLANETDLLQRQEKAEAHLKNLSIAFCIDACRRLGWDISSTTRQTSNSLTERLRIDGAQQGLFHRILDLFQEAGIIHEVEGRWEVIRTSEGSNVTELWRKCLIEFPAYLPRLQLLQAFGSNLAEILRGEVDPRQLLSTASSQTTLANLYQSDPALRMCNTLVERLLMAIVDQAPAERQLRILEIDGTMGSLTSQVLPLLPRPRTSYVFTDPNEENTAQAQERFADHAFLESQVLDMEEDPLAQGFEANSFDIIIAGHARRGAGSSAGTIASVKKLLASDGLLIAVEPHDDFMLPEPRWTEMLRDGGFAAIEALSAHAGSEPPEHAVILARGPRLCPATEDTLPARTPGDWLILADRAGQGEQLAGALKELGARTVLAWQGESFQRLEEGMVRIRTDSAADLERLLLDEFAGPVPLAGIASFWSLDLPAIETAELSDLVEQQARLGASVVELARVCTESGQSQPRLWLITRGAQAVAGAVAPAPAQAVMWGVGRVLANEHPQLRCVLLDLSPACPRDEIQALARELSADGREAEVALRGQDRYVHRLGPLDLAAPVNAMAPPGSASRVALPFRLEASQSGLVDDLSLRASARSLPGPHQVEIEVMATPLNFKDVAKTMHLLGDASLEGTFSGSQLGLECAGRIVSIGAGVEGLGIGDDVVCLAPNSFASHVLADVRALARKPSHLTFEEAATLPVVFLTVYYGLHHLARLQAGERVLIQAASGGVGLAAIQLAQLLGAEIYATAGSPEKRDFLKSLGVQHVMDSRSLDFVDEVLARTGGEGVDVVLNSLGGETLVRSLSLLRECGRFVELGKRDLEFNTRVGLRPFLKQLSFFAVDLDRLVASRPDLSTKLFREVMQLIEQRKLGPLPYVAYPVGRVREAFRTLLKARHIGKLVVSMQQAHVAVVPALPAQPALRPDGTYLITGGLGGFGLAAARWLVEHGVKHLLLLGRSGAGSAAAQEAVAQLQQAGVTVTVAQADVASTDDVARVLAEARQALPPIRGVFHAAMVLDDAPLLELTPQRFQRVLAPKVAGAWNLHTQTRNDPVEHFVLFSSCAAVIGNPAQGNYVAANLFLDMLAHHRRALGLPALAVDWGVVRDVGVVAARTALARHLESVGMIPLPAREMLDALGVLLQTDNVQSTVLRADWSLVRKNFPALKESPRLSLLQSRGRAEDSGGELTEGESLQKLLRSTPTTQRHDTLQGKVCEVVARVLGTAPSKLETDEPMTNLGIDSLMAVELAICIKKELQIDIPTMTFMRGPSIDQLTTSLLDLLLPQENGELATQTTGPP